jgi:hypothetical protein
MGTLLRMRCRDGENSKRRSSVEASHMWDELREKRFHNRVFESIDALEDHLATNLRDLELDRQRVRSIFAWPWIIDALLN